MRHFLAMASAYRLISSFQGLSQGLAPLPFREILRLVWSCGQSRKNTAITCGVGKTTVTDTVARATAAGIKWPLPTLGDETLERLLYPPVLHPLVRNLLQPDWQSLPRSASQRNRGRHRPEYASGPISHLSATGNRCEAEIMEDLAL